MTALKSPIMLQKPIALTLIAMQLLCWSGSSLHLCFCGNTTCVDFGPKACHCCDSHSQCAAEWSEHAGCGADDHLVSHGAVVQSDNSCDRSHVQITVVPGPTIIDPGVSILLADMRTVFAASPAAMSDSPPQPCAFAALNGASAWGDSWPSISLDSVVLRC